jgi:hypothetical protein
MTPQEIWWKTYWAALSGSLDGVDIGGDYAIELAERVADETIRRFVASDGSVYNPRPSDYGVGK